MENGRVGDRLASTYELLYWMIALYETAHVQGNACWHEAEYYALLSQRRAAAYSIHSKGFLTTACNA